MPTTETGSEGRGEDMSYTYTGNVHVHQSEEAKAGTQSTTYNTTEVSFFDPFAFALVFGFTYMNTQNYFYVVPATQYGTVSCHCWGKKTVSWTECR